MLISTNNSKNQLINNKNDKLLKNFKVKLNEVMSDLAEQIVKDGEGASKLVEVSVVGAKNDNSAKLIARSVAESPLVKTAIHGEDPNWEEL